MTLFHFLFKRNDTEYIFATTHDCMYVDGLEDGALVVMKELSPTTVVVTQSGIRALYEHQVLEFGEAFKRCSSVSICYIPRVFISTGSDYAGLKRSLKCE